MARSIVILLVIVATVSFMADMFSNLVRILEVRALRIELLKFDRAFRSIKKVTYYEKEIPEPVDKINVVDDGSDDLPKFGDF